MFHDKQSNIKIGALGEELACEYLKNNGYTIIDRNFRRFYGEIDIIAKKGRLLVFFEVKTLKMRQDDSANGSSWFLDSKLMPEDNLTSSKLRKLRKICEMFAVKHSELVDENKGWQIDLLTIIYSDESNLTTISASLEDYQILTIKGKYCLIKHYENIG
jgi:putative endonuclease